MNTMTSSNLLKILWQRRWLAAAILLAATAGAYGLAHLWLGPQLNAYPVVRSDLIQTVVASGRVETPLRVDIGSQITGSVAAIPVAEGQTVKAGQLLIALESSEATAAADQARAAVVQAQARLKQIRDVALPVALQALSQAEANLQNVRRQHERSRDLQSKGFVGQSQLDDARHNLDVAQSQLRTAQLQVETSRSEGSDTLLAAAALGQAEASLRMAQAKLKYTRIEAPTDGTLIARNVEPGNVVQPGKALMVLSPAGKTQVVVQIDERNLASMQKGRSALCAADAYPSRKFSAEVVYINPAVDPQRGSVEVKLDVAAPPAFLRQDMTVSVDIEVARRSNTLVLSAETLRDGDGNAPWVMKVTDGHARKQTVKPGVRGAGRIEVLDGLQAGDLVLSARVVNVTEGQPLRNLKHLAPGRPQ
jgi:HlyD family secretion protein